MAASREYKTLGVIPARAGSKRVPGKNLRLLNNRPLIEYTITAAANSERLDRFIVSTEDDEIAKVARDAGADVPFQRPIELAGDDVPDRLVLVHAIEWFAQNEGFEADIVILLRPTSPFKTAELIDQAIGLLVKTGADSVRTVTKVEGVHHPYWMFKSDEKGRAKPFVSNVSLDKYYRRQLLPPAFRLNGVVDVIKSKVVLKGEKLYGERMHLLEVPDETALDIDTNLDFLVCETLLKEKE